MDKLQAIFEAGIPFKLEVYDKHSIDCSTDYLGYTNWDSYTSCLTMAEAIDWLYANTVGKEAKE